MALLFYIIYLIFLGLGGFGAKATGIATPFNFGGTTAPTTSTGGLFSGGFGAKATASSGFGGFGVKPTLSTGFTGFGTKPAATGFGGFGTTPAATGFGGFGATAAAAPGF